MWRPAAGRTPWELPASEGATSWISRPASLQSPRTPVLRNRTWPKINCPLDISLAHFFSRIVDRSRQHFANSRFVRALSCRPEGSPRTQSACRSCDFSARAARAAARLPFILDVPVEVKRFGVVLESGLDDQVEAAQPDLLRLVPRQPLNPAHEDPVPQRD